MPILQTVHKNLGCPMVYCDLCKKRIKRPNQGVYAWPGAQYPEHTSPERRHCSLAPQPISFFHHDCFERFTTTDGITTFWGAIRLDVFPGFLRNNLGLTQKQVDYELESQAHLAAVLP